MAKQEITLQGIDGQLDELILTTNDVTSSGKLEDCARLLFPQEGETIPRLRFKGFEGEWTEATLGELFMERNESNINGEMLSVTMNNGIIKASDNGRFDNSNSDKSHYKVVKVNDIAYNSMRMWQGASGCSAYEGIVSPAYTVVTPIEGIDPNFFACLFKTPTIIKKFRLHSQGLTSDTWNLKYPAFSKISVLYPKDIKEQRLIASFFKRLDSQLLLHQQQFERLRQLKSACLDSMFPQQSENTPPIRFNGYDGKWIEAKLSTYASRITRKNVNMESNLPLTISASDGLIAQTAFFNNVVASTNMSGYYLLKKGEFAYNKSYSNGYPFGAVKKLEKYEQGALSPLYIVFSLAKSVNDDYMVYFFETDLWHKEVAKRAAEGARNHGLLNIGADDFLDIKITLPEDIREQEQIASFFQKLDSQISAQQQRLEQLKQMKSACLDGMFPQNGGGISRH